MACHTKFAWLVGMVWVTLSCSDPLEPEPLEVSRGTGGDRVAVTAGPDYIVIEGVIRLPLSCYEVRGASRRDGNDLELVVTASSPNLPCLTIGGVDSYHAMFGDLRPGSYRYRVTHEGGVQEARFAGRVEVGR